MKPMETRRSWITRVRLVLITAALLGFQTPSTKPLVMGATLLLLLTLATVLILDLDGPTRGAIIEITPRLNALPLLAGSEVARQAQVTGGHVAARAGSVEVVDFSSHFEVRDRRRHHR